VEQRLVEIVGHPNVVGIDGPRAHRNFPSGTRWRRRIGPDPETVQPAACGDNRDMSVTRFSSCR
jgi:hypothetical protein